MVFAFAAMTFCNAQKIEMTKIFGGYKFTQDGTPLNRRDLVKTMQPNQEAFDLIKKSQSNNTLASIFSFVGGGLIGWPIGTAIGGGEPNWTLAGVGAGLIVISIPISSNAGKKAKQAVELYNSSLSQTSYNENKPKLKLVANGHGIGISMNF